MKTTHIISDIMSNMNGAPGVKVGKVDEPTYKKIERWKVDYKIKRLIQWHWFIKDCHVGFDILSAKSIVKIEAQYNNLKLGYLQIGECPNGDRVYIKESDFSVWYWSHDEATNWDQIQTKALHLTYPSIDYLLLSIRNRLFIPCDSYSAREYYELFKFSYGKNSKG